MKNNFIKVVNQDVANNLVALGFQYIKEQNVFVFPYSDEIMVVLQRQYSSPQFVTENKLRF